MAPARPHGWSGSKRSRAAEVHNLSEKRRRSRINEKMKALQSLIPNSNKTDKASILDGAIEYLKQLQPQVQKMEQEKLVKLTRTLCKYINSAAGEQASSTPSYAANDAKTGGGPTESTSAGVLTDKNRKYPVAVIIEMGFKPEFPLDIIDED